MRDYYVTCPFCGGEFSFEAGEWDILDHVFCPFTGKKIELEFDTCFNPESGEWQICYPKQLKE